MPIAPRLPLDRDFVYGYGMNDTIKDTVRQNLTNLSLSIRWCLLISKVE